MRLTIFPNTYAEVILLRLCEININAFLSNGGKQMPITLITICALNSQSTEFSLGKKYSVHSDRQRWPRAIRTDCIGREYSAL